MSRCMSRCMWWRAGGSLRSARMTPRDPKCLAPSGLAAQPVSHWRRTFFCGTENQKRRPNESWDYTTLSLHIFTKTSRARVQVFGSFLMPSCGSIIDFVVMQWRGVGFEGMEHDGTTWSTGPENSNLWLASHSDVPRRPLQKDVTSCHYIWLNWRKNI